MTDCIIGLKQEYVQSLGKEAVIFVERGKEISGDFDGFEGDFAVIQHRTNETRNLVLIPKSAILYIIGKQRHFNF